MRKLTSLLGNSQKLDGGAMFGNAPKALWSRWVAPDEQNRIPLACRCLLVEENDGRRVLFETGIGAFFEPKMRERFGVVETEHVLVNELKRNGIAPAEIDIVVLSHLHFDHAGGLLTAYSEDEELELVFENATLITSTEAYARAQKPHPRDRASFIPRLQELLTTTDRLRLVDLATESASALLGPGYAFHTSHGHTPGLMLTEIPTEDGPLLFGGDLIPGAPWMHAPITMGYDRFPELLIDEKRRLLEDLHSRNGRVFFTHDHDTAAARVGKDERGRFFAEAPVATFSM